MAIANNATTLNVPIMGIPFFQTEDTFSASSLLDFSSGFGGTQGALPQEIIIACKNKRRRICGYLSEGIKINGVSQWIDAFSGGGAGPVASMLTKGLDMVSNIAQTGMFLVKAGTSFQQPWQQRQIWSSTKPFSLSFNFSFVSDGGTSRAMVVEPAIALLSFLYPRKIDVSEITAEKNISGAINAIGNALGSHVFDFNGRTVSGEHKNVAASATQALVPFAIPGPSLLFTGGTTSDDAGDAVTITVGNMFAFGGCYLKTVNLEFSPNTDKTGYPTWCKCSITAEAMDANYCQRDGSFMISQWHNSQAGLSDFMGAIAETTRQAVTDAINIGKSTINALKAPFFGQVK